MGSMTLELELVDDVNEPIVMPDSAISTDDKIALLRFSIGNTSNDWQIENVQIKTELITLDNGLQNTYDAHLLSGNAYPINYNTFITQSQNVIGGADAAGLSLGQQKINLSVSRAVTRLKSVFITLDKAIPYENDSKARKPWNDFYSPMHAYATPYEGNNSMYDQRGEFETQIQIGSKKYPETEMRSHAEAYYQLKKCLGFQSSSVHSFDISASEYRNSKFIMGYDLEKKLGSGFTGVSTKAGDLMTIRFNHLDTEPNNYATQVYITLHSDNVLEIRESGISVFD